ncbi:MAG: nucleotidyltransferase domain-containing protein [Armatimonadetes bacterium]|nr:nucleotidyltransferase domain-containing protein [Armatimonadota bacterium]
MVDSRSMAGDEMQQLHLTPGEQQTISQLTEMLRRDYGSIIENIRLYGSKARGDSTLESDLDVLVLTRQVIDLATKRAIRDRATDVDIDDGTVTSLLFFSVDQWNHPVNRITGLYKAVAREGVAL